MKHFLSTLSMSISLQTLYGNVMRKKKRNQICVFKMSKSLNKDVALGYERKREREDISVFSNHDHKVTVGALPPHNHKLCCHNVAFECSAYR